jgi:hypothetical protein
MPFRVLLSLAQMQNVGPIYKAKNVYSLMFMLVIVHRAYVLKLFLGILHLDRNRSLFPLFFNYLSNEDRHLLFISAFDYGFKIKIARKITAFNKICTHHQYFFLTKK